jgi:hypothetical protein
LVSEFFCYSVLPQSVASYNQDYPWIQVKPVSSSSLQHGFQCVDQMVFSDLPAKRWDEISPFEVVTLCFSLE